MDPELTEEQEDEILALMVANRLAEVGDDPSIPIEDLPEFDNI